MNGLFCVYIQAPNVKLSAFHSYNQHRYFYFIRCA